MCSNIIFHVLHCWIALKCLQSEVLVGNSMFKEQIYWVTLLPEVTKWQFKQTVLKRLMFEDLTL